MGLVRVDGGPFVLVTDRWVEIYPPVVMGWITTQRDGMRLSHMLGPHALVAAYTQVVRAERTGRFELGEAQVGDETEVSGRALLTAGLFASRRRRSVSSSGRRESE